MHHKRVLAGPPKCDLDSYEVFVDCLLQFGACPLFADVDEWEMDDNPYRRALRPHVLQYLNFRQPLSRGELLTYASLAANRVLTTIYEMDFVFLPERMDGGKRRDFEAFYSPQLKQLADVVRPGLERFVCAFLDDSVQVSGPWDADSVETLFKDYAGKIRQNECVPVVAACRASADPFHALKTLLIQLAPDFLVESSPMARNILGHYGPMQSELFKIVIDEYGYGVHRTKHSTLYKNTMASAGLKPDPHRYWQFYLSTSLLLNNYYNMICKDHSKFFRYIGAIYQAETAFVPLCAQLAGLCREVLGPTADVEYFLEHAHIDRDHSRMVYEGLVRPALEIGGTAAALDIVRGFEEAKLLGEISDADLCAQICWSDDNPSLKRLHGAVYERIADGRVRAPIQTFIEPRGELSVSHVHDGDELCHIECGTMRFMNGHGRYELLNAGEGIVIRRNRLHGAIIDTEECKYHIHSIGDCQACLR